MAKVSKKRMLAKEDRIAPKCISMDKTHMSAMPKVHMPSQLGAEANVNM